LFINDDGTVPQYMEDPSTYEGGRYNNYNVQSSLIDEDGNYPAPAASLTGAITCIDYDEDSDSYRVYYTVQNRSDASAAAIQGIAVSFYSGNPDTGGIRIGTTYTESTLAAGSTSVVYTYQIPSEDIEILYMVVNTDRYPMILSERSY